jgi:hypothetical protein
MKKTMIKQYVLCAAFAFGTIQFTQAQQNVGQSIGTLLTATDDAGLIMSEYLKPMFNGFGVGLNNGWYNTGNVHKTGRFDLTVNLNGTFAPKGDLTFDAQQLNTQFFKWDNTSAAQTATVFGDAQAPTASFYKAIEFNGQPQDSIVLKLPAGVDYSLGLVPTPMIQLGVGIYKGTEVIGRFMPTTKIGELGSVGLYGFGIKHDIKQWLPGIKELPFDLSALAGFTKFNLELPLNVPAFTSSGSSNSNVDTSTQRMTLGTSSTTLNVIVSKKLAVLTVYAGAGLMTTSTDLNVLGNYIVEVPNDQYQGPPNTDYTKESVLSNPIKMKAGSMTSPNLTAGFRLKLAVVTIGASYTLHRYQNANFNLGVAVDFL